MAETAARRITFVAGNKLLEGDTLLTWWGFARLIGFTPGSEINARICGPHRFAVFAADGGMTIPDSRRCPIVVACPADVDRGGLPDNGTTKIPTGWTVDYGTNIWLDALDYITVADVLASTSWAQRRDGGTDPHRWLIDDDEALRPSEAVFARYCAEVRAKA